MDAIENAAYVSVGRACGFTGLAIFCLMFGMSFEPALAARTGGTLCLAVTFILAFQAYRARMRPFRRTEVWIILRKEDRPPAEIAQKLIGETLRRVYLWFAQSAAIFAFVLLISAIILYLA